MNKAKEVSQNSKLDSLLRRHVAEKKPVVERAEVECCEPKFDVKKLTQMWKI